MLRKKKAKYHPLTRSAPSALARKNGNSAPEIYSVSLGSTALVPLPTEPSKECHFVSFPVAEKVIMQGLHQTALGQWIWSNLFWRRCSPQWYWRVKFSYENQCVFNARVIWHCYEKLILFFANIWNVPLLKEWQYQCGVVMETSCSFLWLWCSLLQFLHVYDFLLLEMK